MQQTNLPSKLSPLSQARNQVVLGLKQYADNSRIVIPLGYLPPCFQNYRDWLRHRVFQESFITLRRSKERFHSRVFLLRQLWIVNYHVKSQSNNLSNENINTGVSVVLQTKRKLKCQNELFLKYNFFGNTKIYVIISEII